MAPSVRCECVTATACSGRVAEPETPGPGHCRDIAEVREVMAVNESLKPLCLSFEDKLFRKNFCNFLELVY